MTNLRHNPISCTGRDQKDWGLRSLEVEAEQKEPDRQADDEYLPTDIFLDLKTIKDHFQYSSIRNQMGIH